MDIVIGKFLNYLYLGLSTLLGDLFMCAESDLTIEKISVNIYFGV